MVVSFDVTPQEKVAIEALLKKMRKDAREADAKKRAASRKGVRMFLPSDSQRRIYSGYVRAYHDIYIDKQDVPHKQLMLHYAAIYHAIAIKTGLSRDCFHGPDFDSFMIYDCGIIYNSSDKPRGRYRQVQDTFLRYKDCRKSKTTNDREQSDARMPRGRALFREMTSRNVTPSVKDISSMSDAVPSDVREERNVHPLNEQLIGIYFDAIRNMQQLMGKDDMVQYRYAQVPKSIPEGI
ncbi:MAG: hypothetical protein Q4E68_10695 [Prevotellaceae bacterium]|nr:hypothetical protein [Prevotellaceae bacterium]